jgi:hypothetical protein
MPVSVNVKLRASRKLIILIEAKGWTMFTGLRRLRLPLLMVFTLLFGALPPQVVVNADSPFLVTIWSDTRPRAMSAGSTHIILVNFSNAGEQEETINFRIRAWCYSEAKGKMDFNTEWETITIPRGGKQPGYTAKTHKVSLKVPTDCSPPMSFVRLTNVYSSFVGFEMASTIEGRYQGLAPFNNYVYGPFTKDWYRYNLLAKEPKPTVTGEYQAHHMLPQKYEAQFNKAGVNIHMPAFLRWWCSTKGLPTNHQSQANAYNQLWDNFFASNPNPKTIQIIFFMRSIQGRFTYTC